MNQSRELIFALDLSRKAGEISMKYFNQGVGYEMKSDNTPVTIADKQVEQFIAEAINQEFPGDHVLGEEGTLDSSSLSPCKSGRRWIVDPTDGTYNFARGIPIFCTLLALEQDGEIKLGVISAPAVSDTFWAEKGQGAFKNGKRLAVSKINELADAQLNFGAPKRILQKGLWDGFTRLVQSTYRQRGFGDYLSFALLFEGKAELALETGLKPWDLAAMKIIAEESGGDFHDLKGGDSIYTGDCLASNGLLGQPGLKLLLGS